MASRTFRHNPDSLRRGRAAGLVLLAGLGFASTRASAQDATNGLASTDVGAVGLAAGSVGATGLSDDPLRGTTPGNAGTDVFAQPAPATAETPQSGEPNKFRLRSTVKPVDTSTARARQGLPPLPQLAPYPTLAKPRGAAIDTLNQAAVAPVAAGPTVAALPVPPPTRRPRPDPTPFAPIGYTIGSLRLTPFVEQSLGFDSNPNQTAVGVKPSGFSRTEGGFDLLSLWSSNELRANMHGGYNEFFSDPSANRPDAAGTVNYRFDVNHDIALDAEGRFAITTQRPGSPELNVDVKDRPLVSSFGTSVGGSDSIGRLTLALHGTFDRTEYQNGVLPDGTVVILDDQNFNAYGVTGKASYELTPGLKPFVQITADTRVHDQRIDISGFARDSNGLSGLVGSSFELTHLITGEISAGYGDRAYQDRRLRNLRGPLVDGSLVYAITPLTTLTLHATTSFDETTVVGSPGSESRLVSLQISHELLRNLTLTGIVSYLNTDYVNSTIKENTISGTLKASYNVSRSIVLDATYNHQTLFSTQPSSGFSQDAFMVGLRLQH